jgi:cation:H+ antiporter
LGITAVILPIASEGIKLIDLGMFVLTAVIMLPLAWTGFVLKRWEGVLLIILYIVYVYLIIP